ncbi:hypothetical protein [Ensifer adhaerens]|uniref:hypothetical protein n=1 Tax=Ensifer adhaerens TaxID=106592 RepID=UPI00098EEB56|nr:hypothetical protein [Ensifer adhaerens]
MIAKPKTRTCTLAQREIECATALREEFELLADLAERVGWHWDEIALALLELTDEYAATQRTGVAVDRRRLSAVTVSRTRH